MPQTAEIIIPQEEISSNKNSGMSDVSVGSRVRILDGYYAGEIGYITELLPQENGADGNTEPIGDRAAICIDADTNITLPINNIELLHDDKPRLNR
jgi:hypothetical protein